MVTNGALPASLRASVGGGLQLELGAALTWQRIVADVEREYGWTPTPSPGASGYRTLAQQETLFQQRYSTIFSEGDRNLAHAKTWQGKTWWLRPGVAPAATPGTSNHGYGKAMDVGYLGGFGTTRYNQFKTVAARYGWDNVEGKSINEPWHWVQTRAVTAPTDPTPPTSEADMPLNQADLEAIDRIVVDRVNLILNQREARGLAVLTQADKEAVDKLIVDRLNQRLTQPILSGQQQDKETIDRLITDRLAQALEAHGAGGTVTVDPVAIAKAVNDDAKKRREGWS